MIVAELIRSFRDLRGYQDLFALQKDNYSFGAKPGKMMGKPETFIPRI